MFMESLHVEAHSKIYLSYVAHGDHQVQLSYNHMVTWCHVIMHVIIIAKSRFDVK